eukprot:snap_masked-scaffold14_size734282-processed-gene-2.17 protein:Tk11295 transcript:snap_masked-scaffold14_size734282-processed-gene-2.17-mRNA-1 annotation:"vacuolar protein-sorting-associated protein 25-like"
MPSWRPESDPPLTLAGPAQAHLAGLAGPESPSDHVESSLGRAASRSGLTEVEVHLLSHRVISGTCRERSPRLVAHRSGLDTPAVVRLTVALAAPVGGRVMSDWPWQHSFPPFFTLQPHEPTRVKQLAAWRALILDYCQARKLSRIEVAEIGGSELCHNRELQRRLSPADLLTVLEDLRAHGHLEWATTARQRAHIYWRRPEEWGSLIHSWSQAQGLKLCTLFELGQGDDTREEAFHGLDTELLIKALQTLEVKGQAELFPDRAGVKFF